MNSFNNFISNQSKNWFSHPKEAEKTAEQPQIVDPQSVKSMTSDELASFANTTISPLNIPQEFSSSPDLLVTQLTPLTPLVGLTGAFTKSLSDAVSPFGDQPKLEDSLEATNHLASTPNAIQNDLSIIDDDFVIIPNLDDQHKLEEVHNQVHRSFLGLNKIRQGEQMHFSTNWKTFIPTARGLDQNAVYGLGRFVTGLTKMVKGQSTDATIEQLETTKVDFMELLWLSKSALQGPQLFRRLVEIGRDLNSAIVGEDGVSGLQGFADWVKNNNKMIIRNKTSVEAGAYIQTEIIQAMKEAVYAELESAHSLLSEKEQKWSSNLDNRMMCEYLCDTQERPDFLPYCPELEYTEAEWKHAMALSLQESLSDPGLLAYYGKFQGGKLLTEANVLRGKWEWYNDIPTSLDEHAPKIVLSAIPKQNQVKLLVEEGVRAIISVTEPYEVNAPGMASPNSWKEENIDQLLVSATDFRSMPMVDLLRIAAFIKRCVDKGDKPLIHCKAGRGRSLAGLMAYLMIFEGFSAAGAMKHVQVYRQQAQLKEKDAKWESMEHLEKLLNGDSKLFIQSQEA
ncbi:MAG: dual specificity protein phosphatase family protein [Chlamydiales bacterium]|nr:dual specificity protein phosphatase family protein [Chlamydiales bacterium]